MALAAIIHTSYSVSYQPQISIIQNKSKHNLRHISAKSKPYLVHISNHSKQHLQSQKQFKFKVVIASQYHNFVLVLSTGGNLTGAAVCVLVCPSQMSSRPEEFEFDKRSVNGQNAYFHFWMRMHRYTYLCLSQVAYIKMTLMHILYDLCPTGF